MSFGMLHSLENPVNKNILSEYLWEKMKYQAFLVNYSVPFVFYKARQWEAWQTSVT